MEDEEDINEERAFFQTGNIISFIILLFVLSWGFFYVIEDSEILVNPIDVQVEVAHLLTKKLNPDLFLDEGLNIDLIHRIYPDMIFMFAIGAFMNEEFPNIPRGYCVESAVPVNDSIEDMGLLILSEDGYMIISHGEGFDSNLKLHNLWSAIQMRSLVSNNARAIFLDKTKDDQFVLVEGINGQMFIWSYEQTSMPDVMMNLNSSDIRVALSIGDSELSGGYFFKPDGEIVPLGNENLETAIAVLIFE